MTRRLIDLSVEVYQGMIPFIVSVLAVKWRGASAAVRAVAIVDDPGR